MDSTVLAELRDAVDGLDLPVDGDVLAEAFQVLDRLTAKVTAAAGELDAVELWDAEGATSLASWLRVRAGLTNRDAARHSATARRLRACPVTLQAWLDGVLSGGQVQAITANVSDRTAPLYREHEAELVPVLAGLDVTHTVAAMRDWAAKAKAILDDRDPVDEPGKAHLSPALDGRGRLDADLTAEGHQTVRAALRVALDPKRDDDERTPAEKRHDALVTVCRHYLDHQGTKAAPRHRPHLNVTIDLATLTSGTGQGRFNDGTPRDGGCRFPGCDRPTDRCDAHHVHHWTNGGPTDRENLVLLCARHHTVIHRPGWTLTLDATDAIVQITDPDGRCRTSRPPPAHAYAA